MEHQFTITSEVPTEISPLQEIDLKINHECVVMITFIAGESNNDSDSVYGSISSITFVSNAGDCPIAEQFRNSNNPGGKITGNTLTMYLQ